jgi:hypothetical protein
VHLQGLPHAGRQAMPNLHPAPVAVLEQGMGAVVHIGEGRHELLAPTQPRPSVDGLANPVARGQATLACPRHQV